MGDVKKLDYFVVQQKFKGQGFTNLNESVFGSYLVITAVDVKSVVGKNPFKCIINKQFPYLSIKTKFLILKSITDKLDQKEVDILSKNIKKAKLNSITSRENTTTKKNGASGN